MNDQEKQNIISSLSKLDAWGQLNQLQEECAEVVVAVNKLRRKKHGAYESLCEEIADLKIMIDQMLLMLDKSLIDSFYVQKLSRINERVKNGKL